MTEPSSRPPTRPIKEKFQPWQTVVTCYSAMDRFFPACGLFDLTEGMYHGNPETPYDEAQSSQLDYLLDQILCKQGRRVLDIGCGYGTLVEKVRQRGAMGVGITVSPEQLRHCLKNKLDVFLFDYRALPDEWDRTFDGIIANGSLEHFVRPSDAAAGKQDEIYRHLFARVHRLIDPDSSARRFVTTSIHFVRNPADPLDLVKNPFYFRWGSDDFHRAVLARGWGGFYPQTGQLRRCANGYFDLIEENDGTEDYRLTSDEWLQRARRALVSAKVVKIVARLIPVLVRSPGQVLTLLLYLLSSESWNWQFRPPDPPMRLLRQTWAYREQS